MLIESKSCCSRMIGIKGVIFPMAESNENTTAEEQDRAEWDRLWSSMETREVERATELDLETLFQMDFGPPLSAVASKVPEQYIEKMYYPTRFCPLCTQPASNFESIYAASLSIEFERIKNLGVSVWIHRECFDSLPLSDKPSPVPW